MSFGAPNSILCYHVCTAVGSRGHALNCPLLIDRIWWKAIKMQLNGHFKWIYVYGNADILVYRTIIVLFGYSLQCMLQQFTYQERVQCTQNHKVFGPFFPSNGRLLTYHCHQSMCIMWNLQFFNVNIWDCFGIWMAFQHVPLVWRCAVLWCYILYAVPKCVKAFDRIGCQIQPLSVWVYGRTRTGMTTFAVFGYSDGPCWSSVWRTAFVFVLCQQTQATKHERIQFDVRCMI